MPTHDNFRARVSTKSETVPTHDDFRAWVSTKSETVPTHYNFRARVSTKNKNRYFTRLFQSEVAIHFNIQLISCNISSAEYPPCQYDEYDIVNREYCDRERQCHSIYRYSATFFILSQIQIGKK